jgi:type IV pilus assembly protein PilC
MEYRCRLGTPEGQVVEEIHVADGEARLRHELEQRGICVLAIRPTGLRGRYAVPAAAPRKRIPGREFVMFNQELATLLKAGMPLVQSLDILRERIAHPTFRAVLDDVHERVRAGTALSDAFAEQGDLFPSAYVASLMAGEKSGNLDGVLRRYVSYMKVIGAVRRKMLSALIYPAVLTGLSLVVVAIIVLKVVPVFADFYETFGSRLPLATRVIVGVSTVVRENFVVLATLAVIAGVLFWRWVRRPEQRALFDRLVLRTPWLGSTVTRFATSQVARTLSTLLGGGLPLVNAIEIASRSASNQFLARELRVAGERVREGESFAAALEARGSFPDVAVKMVEVGEATGALQDMLSSLADFYDEEIETDLGRFITLVEPLLLIVMGIVIASLLLALYMPLFGLTSVVGGGPV